MRRPLTVVLLSSGSGEGIFTDHPPAGVLTAVFEALPPNWAVVLVSGPTLPLISHSCGCRQGKAVHLRLRPEHLVHHSAGYLQGWVVDQGRQVAGGPRLQEP